MFIGNTGNLRLVRALAAVVALLGVSGVCSGEDFTGMSLDELLRVEIDSASMDGGAASEEPATVYLVDRREMEDYGYRDLRDVLRNLPGVAYGYPHSWLQGGQRGLAGSWSTSKLLVNGMPTNLLWSGEAYIAGQFPLHNVRRVELVQGPASALYGADAFSGVINIVTDTPENSGDYSRSEAATASVESNFDNRSLSLAAVRHHGRAGFALAAYTYEGNGPDYTDFLSGAGYSLVNTAVRADQLRGPSPYRDDDRSATGSFTASYDLGDSRIDGGVYFFRNRDGGGIENAELSYTGFRDIREQVHFFLDYGFHPASSPLTVRARFQRLNEDDRIAFQSRTDTSVLPPPLYEFRIDGSRMNRGRVQADYDFPGGGNRLSVGAEYQDVEIGTPVYPPDDLSALYPFLRQRKRSLFVQDQHFLAGRRLRLMAGGRYDRHNIYGEVATARCGAGITPVEGLDLKLLYGEAFREPTVFELSTNPTLSPARMRTTELAWVWTRPKLTVQGGVYWSRASDLIEQDRGGGGASRNVGTTRVRGGEVLVRWRRGAFDGDLWYSLVDRDDGLDVPEHSAGAGVVWRFSRHATAALRGRYCSGVDTMAMAADSSLFRARVPEYAGVDINVTARRRQVPMTGALADYGISVSNLFNRSNYYPNVRGPDPVMYRAEGRVVGMRVVFYY